MAVGALAAIIFARAARRFAIDLRVVAFSHARQTHVIT